MRKPRVVHVYKDVYPPIDGGIERSIYHITRLTQPRFETAVITASSDFRGHRRFIDEDIEVIEVPSLGRMMSTPVAPGFITALRRSKADLFHFHFPHPTGELAYLLSGLKTPSVVTYHADVVRQRLALSLYRPFMKAFLNRMHVIMPTTRRYMETSEFLRPFLSRCRPVALGFPAEDYEPTDQTRPMSDGFRQRWGDFIFFIGVLRYYKGLRYLIQALPDVPDAQLVIAGDGSERSTLEELTEQLGLSKRVHFLGRVDNPTAIALFHAASIFCLPACERAEAFGLCQIEAMLTNLPIVSTNLPTGVPEINLHGETGLIVEPKQSSELAAALRQLLGDEQLRRQMGEAGRKRALAEYTAERMAQQVQDVYLEVIGDSE